MGSEFVELYRITDFTAKNMNFKAVRRLVLTFAVINVCHNIHDITRSIRSDIFSQSKNATV
jgi:translation elongation factor EF-Ts